MLNNGLSHGFSFKGVLGGFIKGSLRESSSGGSDWWSGVIEGSHGVEEAFADFTNDVLFWNSDVLESNTSSIGTSLTHIDFLSTRLDTFPLTLNNEASEGFRRWALRVWVGSGEYEVPVGDATVRDPHFLTVEDPLVTDLLGLALETRNIRSGARFSDTIRGLKDYKGVFTY